MNLDKKVIETQLNCPENRNFQDFNYKVVVLDDDPTGTQTVKDLNVYTTWQKEYIEDGFDADHNMFFIMTNSRALSEAETKAVHEKIIQTVERVSSEKGIPFIIISRGDSTLRGHYYYEPKVIHKNSPEGFDAVFYIPAFFEGGRYTYEGIHYLEENDEFIPVSESEFSNDSTFGFNSKHLQDYIEEKSDGEVRSENVVHIPLDMIRSCDTHALIKIFDGLNAFDQVIVDAVNNRDMEFFAGVMMEYLKSHNKKFIFRTAASFVRAICQTPGEILAREEIIQPDNENGGIIVVGSHVDKTTKQLKHLMEHSDIHEIEFSVQKVIEESQLTEYVNTLRDEVSKLISVGKDVVVYTSRGLIRTEDKEESLRISKSISDSLVQIVSTLDVKPGFIIAKGGITSSDVATEGIKVKKAYVLGQAEKGIPVWETNEDAKYPHIPYIVFPGNVGEDHTLYDVYKKISHEE